MQEKRYIRHTIYILLIILVKTINSQGVPPTWLTSDLFQVDSKKVISSATGSTVPPSVYTFMFNNSFNSSPSIAYGVKHYVGYDRLVTEKFQINLIGLNATSFEVSIKIIGGTTVLILEVAYIAVNPNFPHHFNTFDNVAVNYTGPLTNISVHSLQTRYFFQEIDYNAQCNSKNFTNNLFNTPFSRNKIVLLLTTFQQDDRLTSPYYPQQFETKVDIINSTHYLMNTTVAPNNQMFNLHYSMIVFDEIDIVSANKYQVVYIDLIFTGAGGTISVPGQFKDNFIMALRDFKSDIGMCGIFYNWVFDPLNNLVTVDPSVVGPSSTSSCGLNHIRSSVIYLKTWKCPATHPNYNISTNLCGQDLCPITCLCSGYVLPMIDGQCSTLCGDGIMVLSEECDDGNINNFDGCSSECKIQQNWICNSNGTCCQISVPIVLKIQSIYKVVKKNEVQIKLEMQPYFPIFQNIGVLNPNSVYINQTSISCFSIFIDENSKTINMKFNYTSSINNLYIHVDIVPTILPASSQCPIFINSIQVDFQLSPKNSIAVIYYSQEEYKDLQNMEKLFKGIEIVSYFILFTSLLSFKIVGIQLFGVLQLAFLTLSNQNEINLMLTPLIGFKMFNGINIPLSKYFQQNNLPNRVSTLSYFSLFIDNFNIMFIIIFAVIILGLLMYFITKPTPNRQSTKLHTISKHILKQVLITLILFNVLNFSFSSSLSFKYSSINEPYYYLSLMISLLTNVILILMMFFFIFSTNKQFGEYKLKFKKDGPSSYYILFTLIYRTSLGYYLAAKNENQISTLLIISFSLIFMMYFLINLPFKQAIQNYRAAICHTTMIVSLFTTMFSRNCKSNDQTARQFFLPYLQITAILLTVIFSLIVLLIQLLTYLKTKLLLKKIISEQNIKVNEQSMVENYQNTIEQMNSVPFKNLIFEN